MSESTQTSKSAEARQQEIDEKTSPGQYALKQVKILGTTLIGGVAGYFAFKAIRNTSVAKPIIGFLDRYISGFDRGSDHTRDLVTKGFGAIGAFIGMIGAGIFNAYGHWKKVESEKLAVDEINTDIGNLMQERKQFAETLNRQESFIKNLIEERKAKGANATERAASAQSIELPANGR